MLEFRLVDGGADGEHVLRTAAGSELVATANGAPPPARLLVLVGACAATAVPLEVLARDDEGRLRLAGLPGGAGGTIELAPLDRPPVDAPDAVVLVPISGLPDVPPAATVVDDVIDVRDAVVAPAAMGTPAA